MKRRESMHLTEEEFLELVLGQPSEAEEARMEEHLVACSRCRAFVSTFSLPSEEPDAGWPEDRETAFNLKLKELFGGSIPNEIDPPQDAASENSSRRRLKDQLEDIKIELTPSALQVATEGEGQHGEAENSIVRWSISRDEDDNLVVELGSTHMELEGARIRMKLGDLQAEASLDNVEPRQLKGRAVFPDSQTTKVPFGAALRLELVEEKH